MAENQNNSAIDSDASELNFDIRQYVHIVFKRKWIIAATIAVMVTGTVLYTLRQPKIYEASASMVIDPKPPEYLGGEVQEIVQLGAGQFWWNAEYYNTQVDILRSRSLARMTVISHKLYDNPKLTVGAGASREARIDAAIGFLLGAISIKQEKENRIFHVRVRHPDPQLAAHVANAHVATYVEYNLNLRKEGTDVASKWLSGELDAAEKKVRDSETALFAFRQENKILAPSIEEELKLIAGNIQRYTDGLNDARTKVIELGALRKQLKNISDRDILESTVFSLSGSSTGELLKQQYYDELKKQTEMAQELGEKNSQFIAQKQKVEHLFGALKKEAKILADTVDQKYQAAADQVSQYEKELAKYRQEQFTLGPIADEYRRLSRKENSDVEKYNIVLGRLRTSDLSSRLTAINIRPLDEALVPGDPAFPRMDRNLMIAGLLSLVLGVGLAFLLEFLDRTVKTTQHVEEAVGAPLLGIIPVIIGELAKGKSRDLHVFEEPSSRAAECCRQIRTNLLFTSASADKQFETLVVASPNPREGKSMTVMYLATTMAQSGQRVLMIDSDMRRPRLHKALGVSRGQGLSNLIVGEVKPDDVIRSTTIPNLYLLPCGPTPPNPAELLMSARFKEVMGMLRERFDRILLDSPPVLAVTDALVLAQQADGVVMVMKAGSTTRDDARRAAKQLYGVEARVAGVVLNELDIEDRSYGYYYHYYGYGYGKDSQGSEASAAG